MENHNPENRQKPGKLLIVADDFTGAADTGVQFGKNMLRTMVITATEDIRDTLEKCDVLALSTESRFDNMGTAYSKAFEAGKAARQAEIAHYYKKLDSTMRGNIGAEIAGLMDSLGIGITFVVPALPRYGRTTINGNVYINGTLLEETEFAGDPKNPVKESFIPRIISGQTDKKTGVIIHEYVRAGRQTLTEKLQYQLDAGMQIIVFDATEEKDLDLIASVLSELKMKILFAGCSGLAEYLAKYLVIRPDRKGSIVIAGSVSDVTRRQIDFAVHYLRVRLVDIGTTKIFSSERDLERERILSIAAESALNGEDLIIRSAPTREAVTYTFEAGEASGLDRFSASESVADFLGGIASEIIRNTGIKGILLTGGDTAFKTARSLKVSGLILQDEIEHGIPFGHYSDERYRNTIIVSKAGGFGNEDAIFRVLNFLRNI